MSLEQPQLTPQRGRRRWWGLWSGAAVAALLFFGGWWYFFLPVGGSGAPRYLSVPVGASAEAIAQKLTAAGLLRSRWGFLWLADERGLAERLRSGTYRLSPGLAPGAILADLVRGTRYHTVSVPPGATVAEVVRRLLAEHIGTAGAYARLMKTGLPGMPRDGRGARDRLEGYLYPATYAFPRGIGAEKAIEMMWTPFHTRVLEKRHALPDGITVRQWITLASVVQAEVGGGRFAPAVAAVFLNRLHLGMPLQSDATVRYAASRGEKSLGSADFRNPSPYNTYRHRGLPPSPIDLPGAGALQAVLHPARVPYLYFVTLPSGRAEFAVTYQGQIRHLERLDKGKIGKTSRKKMLRGGIRNGRPGKGLDGGLGIAGARIFHPFGWGFDPGPNRLANDGGRA